MSGFSLGKTPILTTGVERTDDTNAEADPNGKSFWIGSGPRVSKSVKTQFGKLMESWSGFCDETLFTMQSVRIIIAEISSILMV